MQQKCNRELNRRNSVQMWDQGNYTLLSVCQLDIKITSFGQFFIAPSYHCFAHPYIPMLVLSMVFPYFLFPGPLKKLPLSEHCLTV